MATRIVTRLGREILVILVCSISMVGQTPIAQQVRTHFERAEQALRDHQPELAAKEFREVLRLDPGRAEARANLGLIAFDAGRFKEAAGCFEKALKLKPLLWNAQAYLGMTQLRLGNEREAATLLETSFPHLQDARVRLRAGMDLISIDRRSNQFDHAVDVLRALEKTNAGDPDVLYSAYRVYSDLASRSVAGLLRNAPESARMHEILGQTAESQDDFAGAIVQYRKALDLDSRAVGTHLELGRALLSQSQDEASRQQAQSEFNAELAVDPASGEAEYYLGLISWLRSDPEQALQHDSLAVKRLPNSPDPRISMSRALSALGRPKEALEQLLEAVRLDPENELAHYRLAQVYEKLGRTQEAGQERSTFEKLQNARANFRALNQQLRQPNNMFKTLEPSAP